MDTTSAARAQAPTTDNYAHIATGSAQEPNFTFQDGSNTGHVDAVNLTSTTRVVSLSVSGAGYTMAPAVTQRHHVRAGHGYGLREHPGVDADPEQGHSTW